MLYTKLALMKTTGVFLYIVKYCLPWSNVHFSFCKCDEHKCFNRWRALSGDDYICDCCESQCLISKSKRAMLEGKQFLVVLYCGLIISSCFFILLKLQHSLTSGLLALCCIYFGFIILSAIYDKASETKQPIGRLIEYIYIFYFSVAL